MGSSRRSEAAHLVRGSRHRRLSCWATVETTGAGAGRLGRLEPFPRRSENSLARRVAIRRSETTSSSRSSSESLGGSSRTLAIVCGAGDDFLDDAAPRRGRLPCSRERPAIIARSKPNAIGLGLIVAGHHATERPGRRRPCGVDLERRSPTLAVMAEPPRRPTRSQRI